MHMQTPAGRVYVIHYSQKLLIDVITTHRKVYDQLAGDRLDACPGGTLFSAACATETGDKHRRYVGP